MQAGAVDSLVAMLHAGGGEGESKNQSAAGALRAIAVYGGKLSVPCVCRSVRGCGGTQSWFNYRPGSGGSGSALDVLLGGRLCASTTIFQR